MNEMSSRSATENATDETSELGAFGTQPGGRAVLVLGLGNILLTDEGVGVRVMETLRTRYRLPASVDAVDGGTAGMDLIDLIAGYEDLIVIDAMETRGPPGTVKRLANDELSRFLRQKLSPHQLGFTDVLAFLELMEKAPQNIVMIGIQPENLDLGVDLSAALSTGLEHYSEIVARELCDLGLPVELRAAPPA